MEFRVRVSGRYPYPSVFSAENIAATATEEDGVLTIRLDDARYEDFWLELKLEESCVNHGSG